MRAPLASTKGGVMGCSWVCDTRLCAHHLSIGTARCRWANLARRRPKCALEIQALHLRLRIARACRRARRDGARYLLDVTLGQTDRERAEIFEQPLLALGPRDRNDVRPPGEQPGERELTGCAALALRDRLDAVNQRHVVGEIALGIARVAAARVVVRERRRVLDLCGQHAP